MKIEKADDLPLACLFLDKLDEDLSAKDKQQVAILFLLII